jgi:hypothetical protein
MSTADIYVFVLEFPHLNPLVSEHCSGLSSGEEFERKIYLFVYSLPLSVEILRQLLRHEVEGCHYGLAVVARLELVLFYLDREISDLGFIGANFLDSPPRILF